MTNSYISQNVPEDKMEVFHLKKFKIERLCENKIFTSVEMLFGNLVLIKGRLNYIQYSKVFIKRPVLLKDLV